MRFIGQDPGALEYGEARRELIVGVVAHRCEGVTGCDLIADLGQHSDADGGIDVVFLRLPSGSEANGRTTDGEGVTALDEA